MRDEMVIYPFITVTSGFALGIRTAKHDKQKNVRLADFRGPKPPKMHSLHYSDLDRFDQGLDFV